MTNQKDIIGLLRELQEREPDNDWKWKVYESLPRISSALLIAVDALEAIASDKTCLSVSCRCGGSQDLEGKAKVAEQALSRIRSLPAE